jgi:enoyl-CoA hydratase/carnithine racemase
MATSEGRITTEKRGHLLLMGVDRVAKMNAFDVAMLRGLVDAYTEMERDDEVRCGVVFAHGEHFTAGLDLANVAPLFAGGQGLVGEGAIDPWGVAGAMRTKPVVMAIHGRCLTLGIELALASDIRVAADNARFAQIEIKRGIFPFGGATLRMPSQFGWGNAMRYLLTGDEFGAAEALRLGLVQEVVPVGAQLERAIALGETVAAQAPLGVRATLRSAWLAVHKGPEAAARELVPELRTLMGSDDAREGMMSFIERRVARFSGK